MTSLQNCFDNVSNCFRVLNANKSGGKREGRLTLAALEICTEEKRL